MTEPGDNRAPEAEGRGRLRASHADRERVIEVLQDAFVQGRLDKGDLDARVGQAFASRTYAELAALTADIPSAPLRPHGRAQNPAPRSHTGRDVAIGLAVGLILAVVIVFGGLLKYGVFGVLAIPIVAVVPIALIASAADKRYSRRQLPPRPEQGAQVLEGQPDGGGIGRDSARPGGRPDPTRSDRTCSDRTCSDRTRSDLRTHGSRARRTKGPVPAASSA